MAATGSEGEESDEEVRIEGLSLTFGLTAIGFVFFPAIHSIEHIFQS